MLFLDENWIIFFPLEGSYIMPTWLTTIFSVVIILGIFAWIGLSIYQKIRQIERNKKDKKEIERKDDKK
ncbi:Spiroplasmavirus-related protein [Spiroplasma kunkelii CR2-3x]|uniref:Spiroplasmavirus-related protein n=1 Tax=Spiroplasma kunkelii CR2-3x TaxID=273035 RepID=A0A0K2JHB8_SPIKU|nr:hypothetical protein [Spiroplasma kunkelii]ALA97989.1 Spiroplasmavirus-related protein [Spiroplasma kunkelii CR2-3x]